MCVGIATRGEETGLCRHHCLKMNKQFFPGDVVGSTKDYDAGMGTYVRNNNIHSLLVGTPIIETNQLSDRKIIHVILPATSKVAAKESIIDIGDQVMCKVLSITMNQANVEIFRVSDRDLKVTAKGIIRREDIRTNDIDALIIRECFLPGDIVRACIISLGDARQYYLSTASDQLGVIYTKTISDDTFLLISSDASGANDVNSKRKFAEINNC